MMPQISKTQALKKKKKTRRGKSDDCPVIKLVLCKKKHKVNTKKKPRRGKSDDCPVIS
jgi:hypothetical protein